MRRLLTALLLLAASAGTAAAQYGTGVIHGTVTDRAHHGPIVQVVVRADLGGRSVAAATDTAGRYLLSGIPPGAWKVEASRIGFRYLIPCRMPNDSASAPMFAAFQK